MVHGSRLLETWNMKLGTFFKKDVPLSHDIASHRLNGGGECRTFAM